MRNFPAELPPANERHGRWRSHRVAFSANGQLIFPFEDAAYKKDSDGSLRFWDVATSTALGEVTGHRGAITSLTYSADGKLLLSGSRDTTALLWSVPLIMKSLDEGR